MKSLPPILRAYRAATRLATPLMPLLLEKRRARGKENAERLRERLGYPGLARPDGRLIWVHAASVGETMSILPLIARLTAQGRVLLTTGTVTSATLAASRLPDGAFHQFIPLDLPAAVERFLDHWRPDLGLICESEIWPNLMMAAAERDIPLGIVNGRMSDRSFRRWGRFSGFIGALLHSLAFCTAQSDGDAGRFRALGAPATSPGNLKFDVPPLPCDEAEKSRLLKAIGNRPVLVAASTHPGEEEQILAASHALATHHPDLLTILVPRHPARGEAVAALIEARGERALRRSTGALPEAGSRFYVADTLGELGLFYGIGTLALIGGSLIEHGGHNPIEAIKRDCPAISGPHVANFRDIFADLVAAGGTELIPTDQLAQAIGRLLADASARKALHAAAKAALQRHEGALDRTMAILAPWLEPGRRD